MGQKIYFDLSGTKGLAPKFYGDINDTVGRPQLRSLGGDGQMAQGYWNPFRAFGYLVQPTSMNSSSIAITETDATYNFESEMRASLYDKGGTTGANGKGIWLADVHNVWYQNSGSGNAPVMANAQHLATNTPVITDLEAYQVNGVKKIFVAYQEQTGAGGDIGIIAPDVTSTNPTWLSGTVSGAFQTGATNDVFMISADNGYMYIFDGSTVHKIDGTTSGGANGTAYPNILIFPPDFVLRDGVDWKAHIWMAVRSSSGTASGNTVNYNERVCGVYVWDRQSVTVNMQDFIPVPGVIDIRKVYITSQGELRIICISAERLTQIRRYNGSTFELVQELGVWAFPQYRDSVTLSGGMIMWLGYDGYMYAHGKLPATQSGTLFYTADNIYQLGYMGSLPNTDFTAGAILLWGSGTAGTFGSAPTINPSIVFAYADSNSNNKVYNWIISGVGTISSVVQKGDAGSVFTLVKRLSGLATVNYLRVYHLPLGSGGSTAMGTLSIYKNQSSSALTNGAVSITQNDVQLGYKHIPIGDKGTKTFALQCKVSWPTTATLSDSTDWQPFLIEVDYDPSPALK